MMNFFGSLPQELRYTVYGICRRKDLLNLSLCSKQINREVMPVIWSRIDINWKHLRPCSSGEAQNMKHTTSLRLHSNFRNFREFREEDTVALNFYTFIQCINPERLKKIEFEGFLFPGGLHLVLGRFPCIQCLFLSDIRSLIPTWSVCYLLHLTHLSIMSCNIVDGNICGISELTSLRYIRICYCSELTAVSLEYISEVSSLTNLIFTATDQITDTDFSNYLPKLHNLTELCLNETNVGIEFFLKAAPMLEKLESLYLSYTNVGESCFIHIATAVNLKTLFLQDCDVTDAALYQVSKLAVLRELNIVSCEKVTDVGIDYISKLKHLCMLELTGCDQLTDQGLMYISKLRSLEEIDISCSGFTDAGLVHLAKLPNLKSVAYETRKIHAPLVTEEGRKAAGLPAFVEELY